ncbi:MAG: pilus assembly protein PilZ [Cycloclasticus sp. symbiont of Poecilosclerida sp. M]|nr:MAG: pilus assembly protein PilZ [Cycloclasticus sp. symbiont of Poecilosclerida sp. M]
MVAKKNKSRPGILSLSIKDKHALFAAFIDYVEGGGIFIPTAKDYGLGDDVHILLSLMESSEKLPITGKVIWVTPSDAQGSRAAGIGVQFKGAESRAARAIIETHLAGMSDSGRPTHTM